MTRVGYVLKVYPRFSETFVVTEILAREAHGDKLRIYALRPTTDARFHPEIARVKAEVSWIPRPLKGIEQWDQIAQAFRHPVLRANFSRSLPELADLPGDEVAQGVVLAQAALDDGIGHLHAHFAALAGRMAWLAARLAGIPYTVTTHAKDIYHESLDPIWLRRVCGDAARVIAISQYNKSYLNAALAGTNANISLRYNALELARFCFRDPIAVTDPLRVVAVGRLVPKKGFGYLIDAISLLTAAGRPVEACIAGDGELRMALQHQINRLGLAEQVRLLGPRTQDEVRELIEQAHVFVAPCVAGEDGNIDGLPTVVLEAMAIGTPVIATALSGLPEVIRDGDTGILLKPGDAAALAGALERIASGQADIARLARNARALIERDFDSRQQAACLSRWETARR